MSGFSDHLHSGQTGAPVGCGGNQADRNARVAGLEGLTPSDLWTTGLRLQEGSQEPSKERLVTSDHFAPSSTSPLANGLHLQRRLVPSNCCRRQAETHGAAADGHTFSHTVRNMQTHSEPDSRAQASSQLLTDDCGHIDMNPQAGSVAPDSSRTIFTEAIHAESPQRSPAPPGGHPASNNQMAAPPSETDLPSTFCPLSVDPNPNPGSPNLPVEAEKKYALRSSGRPRFPCHVRKSSRLRRGLDNGEKRPEKDRAGEEEDKVLEEKIWAVKEDEVAFVSEKEQPPSVEAVLPSAPSPAEITLALTVPKPVPKAVTKAGPRIGHRPGPKSRSRPALKAVHKAAPKSVMRKRQAAQALAHRAAPQLSFSNTSTITAALLNVRQEPFAEFGTASSSSQRRGRFVGVRRIVVKVARIPVSLSRRQKSYKISNLETMTGQERGHDGGLEGAEGVKEPTALLRMKNNGKSVMVMFPPGELPVILKRRRGRPPKQALPGIPGEPQNTGNASGNGDGAKKPQRRRRTKLPSPYPSYVNDTNDVKTEYGDVLSKLAFLNRQPLATGRCSPPRCWTPSEPDSFHTELESPGISTLLHRLTGFRRPRGGRGGGAGRGGGVSRGMGDMRNRSTFSDFFESIGKKRKPSLVSEHGLPRKRGKGVGGVGRGGGVVGTDPGGEKTVRKRRVRKNGALKGEGMSIGQDWPNGAGGWGEEMDIDKEKGFSGYQLCGSPRGSFSSCELGRGGAYGNPGGIRLVGPGGEDSQGLFAGYFRSLLDSDDSSDLLDMSSSRSDPRKPPSTPGYEPSSPAARHGWSPAFPKWSSKVASASLDCSGQLDGSSTRPSFSYGNLPQTSPATSSYPKTTPPSLSHSPSSSHQSSYGPYSSVYSSSSPGVPQRSPDCSFAFGSGHGSSKANTSHMGFSSYQTVFKRGYSGFAAVGPSSVGRGESTGSTSPGGGFMSVAKTNPFISSPADAYKQYNTSQWSCRQGFGGWPPDSFGHQYHGYSEHGSSESKDILDISNYTPQKAKRPPFPETLSESSSDSIHLGSTATTGGPGSTGGAYKQNEEVPVGGEGGQSSLSSLEKLMMDWHDSASGPSYNWSQNVLFQSGGSAKPGRGRRKRTEPQSEKEGGSTLLSDSPSTPSPTPTPGPKRGGMGGRGRGSRGARGGLSPCQRERPSGTKGRGKAASTSGPGGATPAGGPEGSGPFQDGLDYFSGDSSSLSPLATPNPAPPSNYLQDPCEYLSPYSAHPSTPSSEERYPALYPGESSSSLSPSVSSPPYPPKPTPPPPPQSYHPVPSKAFSPSCSPSPRLTSHCGTSLSPPHRPPPKDQQFLQYDSPNYCSSPYWYGQTSHSSSPSPHSHSTHANTVLQTQSNPHTSPHGATHGHSLNSPNANAHSHMTPTLHETHHHNAHASLSSHNNMHASSQLQSNPLSHSSPHTTSSSQPHLNAHANPHLSTHTQSHPSPSLHPHSTPVLYEECSPPSTLLQHKRDLAAHAMSTGHRQGALPHSPYPKPPLDSSPHREDTSSYSHPTYQSIGPRYPSQSSQGVGVLCQLLDPAGDDSFSVTSL